MRFNEFNEGIDPGAKAAIKGMRQLSGDQYYGLYKTMKDVAGHDGEKQTSPGGKTDHEVSDQPFAYAYTDEEKNMIKGVDPKAKQITSDKSEEVKEGSEEHSPVANAITRRITSQRLDLLSKYGPELVTQAIDEVADFVGDVEEIGSSDVSGWIRQVEQMLSNNPPEAFGEGRYDNRDAYQRDYDNSQTNFGRGERDSERHDIDTNNEYRAEHGTWYIRIDGMVDPTPYRGKAAANAAGRELKKQPGNENKLFMLTTKA